VVKTEQQGDSVKISWTHDNEADVFRWVVYYQYGDKWTYTILNHNAQFFMVNKQSGKNKLRNIAVTAVDRTGNESSWKEVSNE